MNELWNVLWSVFGIVVTVGYLVVLVNVVIDLFRDPTTSAWAKVGWILGLVFVPFLTVLVYVLAHGDDMAARRVAESSRSRGPADQIAAARTLLADGVIDEAEFAKLKARALAPA